MYLLYYTKIQFFPFLYNSTFYIICSHHLPQPDLTIQTGGSPIWKASIIKHPLCIGFGY